MQLQINIDQASEKDLADIIDFQLRMALETENLHLDLPVVQRGVRAVFDDEQKGLYFLAKVDAQNVASLMITYEWSDWRNGWVWWIQSVYVKPEFRRHGVFAAMYDYLKARVQQDSNLRGLRLYVDKTNTRAQKVYEAIGMNGEHYAMYEWMKGN
jgi:ribosomal protein S18 acetylase RimI-like enzyme